MRKKIVYHILKEDKENIDELISEFFEFAKTVLNDFESRKVGIEQPHFEMEELQKGGLGFRKSFELFCKKYEPYLSASMGARYFGFVTGGATPASLIADWMTSLYDQNVASLQESSSSDITFETLQQLKSLFELDNSFDGIFVSGATMSNFVGLATAREWFGKHFNKSISQEGLQAVEARLNIYSATPHSSIYKALSMLGVGQDAVKLVKTNADRESINIENLVYHLSQHESLPCIVVANAGTVNTVDFDDIQAIANLKKRYNFWLHIDAAFGGFAKCSAKYKHLIAGLEQADSITIDAHKWLNVPYDSAMHFTKHLELQFEVFKNASPYLQAGFSKTNYVHLTPENSQRFRALPTWFTLNAYGKKGYEEIVERNCALAAHLAKHIKHSDRFNLLSEVILNGICFSLEDENLSAKKVGDFMKLVNLSGKIFITPTVYKNIPALRISISNWQTTSKDMDIAWETLNESYRKLYDEDDFVYLDFCI
jgi:glutamate/tyrosine decarboxylase-like PLP-dependent enzyme